MDEEIFNTVLVDISGVSQELRIRPQIYVKIVKSFVSSLNGKLRILDEALMNRDLDHMRMILHEIKGTAGNLRLQNIIGPEAILHTAVKAGESPKVLAANLEILRRESEKLHQYVSRLPDGSGGDNA